MYTVFVLADIYHAYIKNSLIPKCWIKVSFCVAIHFISELLNICTHAAAAKSLQSCRTLCDPIDDSPPGSPVPGILQARTLEWVAISFSNVWKWKVKVKSLSRVRLLATPWTTADRAPPSMGFSRQEYWSRVPLTSLICTLIYMQICLHTAFLFHFERKIHR